MSSFDFTSLPGQFAHLMIQIYARTDSANTSDAITLRINNDSGANYDYANLQSSASGSVSGGGSSAQTSLTLGSAVGGAGTAGRFGEITAFITAYAQTTGDKSVSTLWSLFRGTATTDGFCGITSGCWRSTSAVTRVTIIPVAGNLASGSRVTIYGLA